MDLMYYFSLAKTEDSFIIWLRKQTRGEQNFSRELRTSAVTSHKEIIFLFKKVRTEFLVYLRLCCDVCT